MKQKCYKGLTFIPYIGSDRIQARVQELGGRITARYEGRNPLLICVLNGAAPFALDLFRAIGTDAEICFVRLSSYEGMASTGRVKQLLGLTESIEDRDVIVVEDIIDTGRTMHKLLEDLRAMKPASLAVATLLFKPAALQCPDVVPDYVGFEIPVKFIIGYGLDIDGMARNLPDIYVLADEA